MLRDDGADAGGAVCGVRANGDGGGRGDCTELPGTRASANKGEGHFVVMSRQVNVSQGHLRFRYHGVSQIGLFMQPPTVVSSVDLLATLAACVVLSNLLLTELFTSDLLAHSSLIEGGVALAAWSPHGGGRP